VRQSDHVAKERAVGFGVLAVEHRVPADDHVAHLRRLFFLVSPAQSQRRIRE
jgi:hypothetical protein